MMIMCVVKASFLVLWVCFFMHASSTTPPIPTSHPPKFEVKKQLQVGPNDQRVSFKSTAEDVCKKYKAIPGGRSSADCKSPPLHKNKAVMQWTGSEEWRWADVNVGSEMDAQHSHEDEEDDLSETDYQPPHRKPPIHN